MPNSTKEIRRRIRSIKNIGQITKAMELVSAAKMRKAQASALASRPYATLSSELLSNLIARTNGYDHFEQSDLPAMPAWQAGKSLLGGISPVGRDGKPSRVLIILVSSDRGLAGAFNSNVVNKALGIVKDEGAKEVDFVTIGKKGSDALLRMKYTLVATFPAKDKNVSLLDAEPIAVMSMDDFLAGKYEKVFVVYTDFVSTLVQKPSMLQLLPFVKEHVTRNNEQKTEFLFEPDPKEILDVLINRAVKFAVYQALVEAAASEHSARMVAMRNANDAAGDLLDELSLSYNQARQAGITRELSEISAAK
ncbi:MAG: ATP synthase F1 subunit gamma, partial [Candidatus Doudnabacteria bacterium RIFCSPLOWO2_02_FULL_42_9]